MLFSFSGWRLARRCLTDHTGDVSNIPVSFLEREYFYTFTPGARKKILKVS